MTYNKKRALSYGGILISVFLAYFCRLGRPENVFMRNLADQCRNCIYLGMYCAWVIYLEKHVVHRKMCIRDRYRTTYTKNMLEKR